MQAPEVQVSPELLQGSLVPHLHTPASHVSVVPLQESTVDEHLHTLFAASQYSPAVCPTQVDAVPHIQVPEVQVSPELLHASLVPHLHTPLSQVSEVSLQASTVDEHLHTLLAASQYSPVVWPTQVDEVPHIQVPETQVSPALEHASLVPHLHTPLSHVSEVPLHASTVDEHLHTLFAESQYSPVVWPTQVEAVPHMQDPETQVSPEFEHADIDAEHLHSLFTASQYDPEVSPTQVSAVPHIHTPDWHVSPELLQALTSSAHLH